MGNKLKHLEFLQNIITRMNSNSFLIKGWAITLISALYALAAKDSNISFVFITWLILPSFWIIDAFFLSQERQYRKLYDEVRKKNEKDINFSMDASIYNVGKNKWLNCAFSKTFLPFYGITTFITILVMFFLG
ncbi:hypothetical protein [Photobacterium leiognathi]|uniref:hypothetical protein n=1 Tax=Photobacterium leiognathi TaxID=553611 RepID=UPI002982A00F|nr:hypothetical protein [Photobacterium leiognathi]